MTSQELGKDAICRGHTMPSASHSQCFSPFRYLKIWFRLKSRTEQTSSSHVAMTDLNWLCTQQGDTNILGACCVRGNILKLGGETLRQSPWTVTVEWATAIRENTGAWRKSVTAGDTREHDGGRSVRPPEKFRQCGGGRQGKEG